MTERFEKMVEDMAQVRRVVTSGPTSSGDGIFHTKLKVPEPKSFCGVQNTKNLENYLFDME